MRRRSMPSNPCRTQANSSNSTQRQAPEMKALVYHGPGERGWDTIADPTILDPTDAIVRIDTSTICGTDLHGDPADADKEQPFGHEIAGVIVEVGSAVLHLQSGQKVVLESATPCGRCDACRNTRQELCMDIQSFFFTGRLVSPKR